MPCIKFLSKGEYNDDDNDNFNALREFDFFMCNTRRWLQQYYANLDH